MEPAVSSDLPFNDRDLTLGLDLFRFSNHITREIALCSTGWVSNCWTSMGHFRLFTSYLFLVGAGTALACVFTWQILPKLWHRLPRDQGRAHAVEATQSEGKPRRGRRDFHFYFYCRRIFICPPWSAISGCFGMPIFGNAGGDFSMTATNGVNTAWGLFDLIISILGAMVVCQMAPVEVWLPLIKTPVIVPPWIYIPHC